ncbi:hypothetical protein CH371_20095 [Leptospira wolffii]|uniref:Uncharacterized protein n=1 Tax=Leptospira wolffii TaxID=409998 RepID=A0A2M9Z6L0_9LEPT|nr:hypothetical protein CH371_20095 [Leptospira wolffii]
MLRTLAWPPAHFALSLILHGKLRAKSYGLAKRRQALVVKRHFCYFFVFNFAASMRREMELNLFKV